MHGIRTTAIPQPTKVRDHVLDEALCFNQVSVEGRQLVADRVRLLLEIERAAQQGQHLTVLRLARDLERIEFRVTAPA